jgi:hypothetical protein
MSGCSRRIESRRLRPRGLPPSPVSARVQAVEDLLEQEPVVQRALLTLTRPGDQTRLGCSKLTDSMSGCSRRIESRRLRPRGLPPSPVSSWTVTGDVRESELRARVQAVEDLLEQEPVVQRALLTPLTLPPPPHSAGARGHTGNRPVWGEDRVLDRFRTRVQAVEDLLEQEPVVQRALLTLTRPGDQTRLGLELHVASGDRHPLTLPPPPHSAGARGHTGNRPVWGGAGACGAARAADPHPARRPDPSGPRAAS